MKKYKLPKMKQGGVAKDTHKTKDGKTAKKGLYYYMNRKKKKGTSNPKSESTVSDKAYANMKAGFPKMRNGGVAGDPPKKYNYKPTWDLQKEFGINPYSTKGIAIAKEITNQATAQGKPYPKFSCSGVGCAAHVSNVEREKLKELFGPKVREERGDAWTKLTPNNKYKTITWTNPKYEKQLKSKLEKKGNETLPDQKSYMPSKDFFNQDLTGKIVTLNRKDNSKSKEYANQSLYPGNQGMEHVGYMVDKNTILHGGKGYYILDTNAPGGIGWLETGEEKYDSKYEPVQIGGDIRIIEEEKRRKKEIEAAKLKQQIGSQMKELQSTLKPNMFINPVESTKQPIIIPNRYGSISFKYGGIMPNKSFCNCNYKKIK